MQWLLGFARVPSVGGYLTRVGGSDAGFTYMPDQMSIGPEEMTGLVSLQPDGAARLQLMPAVGGDRSTFELQCAAGTPPTLGALAYLAVPPGVGVLFCHERPHVPVPIRASSLAELIDIAEAEHGQRLWFG